MGRRILSSNRARILETRANENGCPCPRKLKRNNEHLATRGPPAKIYLGINHQVFRSNNSLNEQNPTLRKRTYDLHTGLSITNSAINGGAYGKFPKSGIDDDVEEMRRKFEQWDSDDCKENADEPVKISKGPKIWHIEAYIEQNVYDDDGTEDSEDTD